MNADQFYREILSLKPSVSDFVNDSISALSIIAVDSASIILSLIYLLVYRKFEGYGFWSIMWFVLACVIYFLLVKFYDCQKAISKISKKPLSYRLISHIISGLFTLFSIWLWIFYGLEFIYQYM